jgi:hypothetical protein
MAVLNTYTKQPNDVLDYDIEYADFLSEGDSLASAIATVSPSGLIVHTPLVVGTTIKLWVEGGTSGVKYKITVKTVTTLSRTKEDELIFRVKDF